MAQAAGGVDRYIRMLLKYLDKEKFENILVCSQDFNREDYDGLVDSFEQIEMNRAIGVSDLNSIKEVRRLIKKYNPDIVYAHSSKAGAIARVADIGLKNHCVYNPHGWAFNMRCSDKKRAMYTAIEKMAAPFCEKIICISDAEKQSALEKKICREDRCVWNQRITLFQCISGNPHCIFLVRFGLAKIHVSEFLDLIGINHTNREPGFLERFQNRIVVMPGIFH